MSEYFTPLTEAVSHLRNIVASAKYWRTKEGWFGGLTAYIYDIT